MGERNREAALKRWANTPPEVKAAHAERISRGVRYAWATGRYDKRFERGYRPPIGCEVLYRTLMSKVGASEARRLVAEHAVAKGYVSCPG